MPMASAIAPILSLVADKRRFASVILTLFVYWGRDAEHLLHAAGHVVLVVMKSRRERFDGCFLLIVLLQVPGSHATLSFADGIWNASF